LALQQYLNGVHFDAESSKQSLLKALDRNGKDGIEENEALQALPFLKTHNLDNLKVLTQAEVKKIIRAMSFNKLSDLGPTCDIPETDFEMVLVTKLGMDRLGIDLDKIFPVNASYSDPATNLIMLRTDATNVPVADFGKAEDLAAGQRLIFLSASPTPYATRFTASFVSFPFSDTSGQVFDSDRPAQSFGVQGVDGVFAGQAVVNLSGEVVGIFDGVTVIPSTTLKIAASYFIDKKTNLIRSSFGFRYKILGPVEAGVLGLPQGAQLTKISNTQPAVTPKSAAAVAGLLEGDVITQVGDSKIDLNNSLETLLQKYQPGEPIILNVFRNGSNISLTIKPGVL
jgi:S1-C subfamily serine protease